MVIYIFHYSSEKQMEYWFSFCEAWKPNMFWKLFSLQNTEKMMLGYCHKSYRPANRKWIILCAFSFQLQIYIFSKSLVPDKATQLQVRPDRTNCIYQFRPKTRRTTNNNKADCTRQVTGPQTHTVTGLDKTKYRFIQNTRHDTMTTKHTVQVTGPDKSHTVTGLDKTLL